MAAPSKRYQEIEKKKRKLIIALIRENNQIK